MLSELRILITTNTANIRINREEIEKLKSIK